MEGIVPPMELHMGCTGVKSRVEPGVRGHGEFTHA